MSAVNDPVPPILLAVQPARPQLGLALAAPGGSLVAGAPYQWLALCLSPHHTAATPFHNLRLILSTPESQSIRLRDHPAAPHPDASVARAGSAGGADDPLLTSGRVALGFNATLMSDAGSRANVSRGLDSGGGGLLAGHNTGTGTGGIDDGLGGVSAMATGGAALDGGGGGLPTCRAHIVLLPPPSPHAPPRDGVAEGPATPPRVGNAALAARPPSGGKRVSTASSAAPGAGGGILSQARSLRTPGGGDAADPDGHRQGSSGAHSYVCGVGRGVINVSRVLRSQPIDSDHTLLTWLPVQCPQLSSNTVQVRLSFSCHA